MPVVIWVHGGGFHEGTRRVFPPTIAPTDPVARVLASGMAVALVDYRLSHESPFPAQLHDLKAAVRTMMLSPRFRMADRTRGQQLVRPPVDLVVHAAKLFDLPFADFLFGVDQASQGVGPL